MGLHFLASTPLPIELESESSGSLCIPKAEHGFLCPATTVMIGFSHQLAETEIAAWEGSLS